MSSSLDLAESQSSVICLVFFFLVCWAKTRRYCRSKNCLKLRIHSNSSPTENYRTPPPLGHFWTSPASRIAPSSLPPVLGGPGRKGQERAVFRGGRPTGKDHRSVGATPEGKYQRRAWRVRHRSVRQLLKRWCGRMRRRECEMRRHIGWKNFWNTAPNMLQKWDGLGHWIHVESNDSRSAVIAFKNVYFRTDPFLETPKLKINQTGLNRG